MPGFLIRMLITSAGLWLAEFLVPGIRVDGVSTLLVAALLLGLVNGFVRPVVVILTFPITLLTLGLFLLVINAAMLGLVAAILAGLTISGFLSALIGSLIISATSWIASSYIGPSGRYEIIVVGREKQNV